MDCFLTIIKEFKDVIFLILTVGSTLWGAHIGGEKTLEATKKAHHLQQKIKKAEREKNIKNERYYLAVVVLACLDEFRDGCYKVASDGGGWDDPPEDERSFCKIVEKAPVFEPLSLNVNWKVLPPDLMADILLLPGKMKNFESYLHFIKKQDDRFYSNFFIERRYGYAQFSLDASNIIKRLREIADLTEIVPAGIFSKPKHDMDMIMEKIIKSLRQKAERKRANAMANTQTHQPPDSA